MENFFVCQKDIQGIGMELKHSLNELNRLTTRKPTSLQCVVQQRLDETWDAFTRRAQRSCESIVSPDVVERYLDKRTFCSLEFNLEGPFHLKAIPCLKGEIHFPWINGFGITEYYYANVFKVQRLIYPQMELLVPIGNESWIQLHGTWQMRINSRNHLYWECHNGQFSNIPKSQVKVAAPPEEQFQNQNNPLQIYDALDKPFECVQSRRLVHSGQ